VTKLLASRSELKGDSPNWTRLSPNMIPLLATGLLLPTSYFSPLLWRRYRMWLIRKAMGGKRQLALTFDDGPSGLTLQVLDLLRERGVRATFFMLGCHVQQHAEIVERVIKEGHQIGCHTNRHLNAWKVLPWKSLADIDAGYECLSRWVPADAAFRPPYGKMTLPTSWWIRRRRASVWWWTIDSGDSLETLPSPAKVSDKLRHEGGGVVLLHDGSLTGRSQERNAYTLAATAALLDVAKAEGIKTVTLGEI
jgi:peptidoglycan/xylan/chitin deacetylase (PgdA/CDA1 family)